VENTSSIRDQLADLKQKKLELLAEKKQYVKTHQLEFFEPQEQQQPIIDDVLDELIRTIIILGGNRSGKSEILVAIVCAFLEHRLIWEPQPTEVELNGKPATQLEIVDGEVVFTDGIEPVGDRFATRFKGPLKIRVLGEDYEKAIGQTLLPKFFRFLRPELIAGKKKNQSGVVCQIVLIDGSVIDFLTYQQSSSSMEGWDGHLVVYDEPPPRAVFIANERGLIDHKGISLFAMTPLKEPWIANELVNKVDKTIKVHVLRTYDNPHIDQEAARKFASKLSDEEKETRIEGKFLHLQGLVFKTFKQATHVIEPFDIPKHWTCYVGIDTHPRTPQALLFMMVDPRSNVYAIHEVFEHGTPEEIVDWIVNFHEKIHKVHAAIIEPGSKGDKNRGDSTFEIIRKGLNAEDIPLIEGSKDLAGGILQVRQVLVTQNGKPAFFVFDHCERLIFEFQNYVWDDWKQTGNSAKSEKQKPLDKDDHLLECARRIIQHPAEYVNPQNIKRLVDLAGTPFSPHNPLAGY